ncbi:hypothetical protein V1291_000814 [Nitrobacteraceae bacterium AZCC 1564]
MALLVSSLPLSLTTIFGLLRVIISRSNSRATRTPESEVSASNRFSRVFSFSSVFSRLASDKSHSAEFRFPVVDAGVADAMLAAQISDRNPGLVLLQNPDDLLFRKTTALHALVLVMGQSGLKTGSSPGGKVRPDRFSEEQRLLREPRGLGMP